MDEQLTKQNKTIPAKTATASWLISWLKKIAAAASIELSKETAAVYVWELAGVSEAELEEAGHRVIREWNEPSKMPTLAFILERVEQTRQAQEQRRIAQASRRVLDRTDKPEAENPNESRADYAKRVIAEMRAKLAAGYYNMPKPQASDYVSHAEFAETEAAKRNGVTTMPEDPTDRPAWARQMAIKNGWVRARQPGEEG
jgi:hypothetical protein